MSENHQKRQLLSALENKRDIWEKLRKGKPAIFLDYDGTLTPIVDDPAQAVLSEEVRMLIKKISEIWTVIIMSGRALKDVRKLVGLENLVYAGSHGFNMAGPQDSFHEEPGKRFLPALNRAESRLKEQVKELNGVCLERKPYAITLHYRQADDETVFRLENRIDEITKKVPGLVKTTGKKIFELRPGMDWNKGKATLYLLEKLYPADSKVVPLYIGDDVTDEDAFKAIASRGIGILVNDEGRETAAEYFLSNPREVEKFLEELLSLAEEEQDHDIWSLVYTDFEPASEKHREALFTLGNGYFATRGAAPESAAGETHYPGTYLAGLYNRLESTVAGKTVENESLVNVPNWLPLTFRIEDEDSFSLEEADILDYRHELDMKNGILSRTVHFSDKKKRRTKLFQRRFIHMRYKNLAALETTIEAENWSGKIKILSALDGRVENSLVERYQQLNNHHLNQLGAGITDDRLIWIQVETNQSHIRIAEAARTRVFQEENPGEPSARLIKEEGYIGEEFDLQIEAGKAIRVEKTVAIYNSRDFAISESLIEAQDALRHAESFEQLLDLHILAWKHLWERWDIKIETKDRNIIKALNLHIFHLLQTISPNIIDLDVGVPPRGLHGEAYRGLIMWDEIFINPLLNLGIPDVTRNLLMYRYRRVPRACWAAEQEGSEGTMFPWQSGSDGSEQAQQWHLNPESGRWIPDDTHLQRHINLAIAYNVWQYYQVTRDDNFLNFYGAELLIRIARFWAAKADYNKSTDRYDIRRVMGPDEFHERYPGSTEPGIDNNAYTNVMVCWLMCWVLEMLEILPAIRKRYILEKLAVSKDEIERWDEMSRKMQIHFHERGIISQFEGYGELKEFDWEGYREKYGDIQRLDRILEAENDSPDNYKASKQADVLMLFYLFSAEELQELFDRMDYSFKPETIPDNIDYYMNRTSHGSTLSYIVHAWVLARSNREHSWYLFQKALQSDIEDIQGGTTHEGIHLAAMAGTVDLLVRCYTGLEKREDVLWFNPQLPPELDCLKFKIVYRDNLLDVNITDSLLTLLSRTDSKLPVTVGFAGNTYQIEPGSSKKFKLK
ncbi:MAG: trehalose-phosphatase [Bacillota bacterium]